MRFSHDRRQVHLKLSGPTSKANRPKPRVGPIKRIASRAAGSPRPRTDPRPRRSSRWELRKKVAAAEGGFIRGLRDTVILLFGHASVPRRAGLRSLAVNADDRIGH